MSQLGGNDSKMVRYLVLFAAVVALAIGGLVFTSMKDAGEIDRSAWWATT